MQNKGDSKGREVKLAILLVFVQNGAEERAVHCNHTSLNAVFLCLEYSNQSNMDFVYKSFMRDFVGCWYISAVHPLYG